MNPPCETVAPDTVNKQEQQTPFCDIKITDQNVALNVMVYLLNRAQEKGAFTFEESSKCFEAIKLFTIPQTEVKQ